MCLGQVDGMIEGWSIRHESRCRENALEVGFENAGVYIPGKAEIVGVDDKAFH